MLSLPDLGPGEPASAASVLVLAVIQGLTEFLPVSSSGHLVLARAALGLRQAGLALDVALHVGTLVAVLWAYRREVGRRWREIRGGRWRNLAWLGLATLPIAVVGVAVKPLIEGGAQRVIVAALGLWGTAGFLAVGERRRPAEDPGGEGAWRDPRWSDALWIGGVQVLALVPGISRSGVTIAVGLARGLGPVEAARLSFLMSIPAVAGAAVVELPGALGQGMGGVAPGVLVAAVVLAALVGWGALRLLLVVLRRGALGWFAGYCTLLGALALFWA